MRTSIRAVPAPDISRQQQQPTITSSHVISLVRSGPRTTNEYVDTPPTRPPLPSKTHQLNFVSTRGGILNGGPSPGSARRILPPVSPRQVVRTSCIDNGSTTANNNNNGPSQRSSRSHLTQPCSMPLVSTTTHSSPVISQPLSKLPPWKKDALSNLDSENQQRSGGVGSDDCRSNPNSSSGHGGNGGGDGIICDRCGKCRCSACTELRRLPSHWCCGDACELSPGKFIEVCTCFCCVKCSFYHCGGPEEDNECYEHPCGCLDTRHCCRRWTVLTAMALCLPCLWAYWPARGCLVGCTHCYNRCRHKGCQCHVNIQKTSVLSGGGAGGTPCNSVGGGVGGVSAVGGGTSKHSQTRRLLIESDSSSA